MQPHHCTLYRAESGEVTLVAEKACRILVDGKKVSDETRLSQGSMLTIGKSNYLRFNNPAEAELLRSTIGSKEHISTAQIDFTNDSGSSDNNSPDADVMMKSDNAFHKNASILETVRKAEFPTNINNFHSPKVFPADAITVNTPAKDVLGPKFYNFTKNLTHMFGNNTVVPVIANNHITQSSDLKEAMTNPSSNFGLTKVNNTSSNTLPLANNKIQQFSACYDRYPKPGSYGHLQVFPMNTVNSEINTNASAPEHPIKVSPQIPKPSITELQRQRAHIERIQEQEVSKMEHERLDEILKMCADFELQNQDGQCSTSLASPVVQNRIKTNGSLPREQKNHNSVCNSSDKGSDCFVSNAKYDARLQTKSKSGYENVKITAGNLVELLDSPSGHQNITPTKKIGYVPQSPRNRIKTCASPKKDLPTKNVEYDLLVQSFEEKLLMEIQLIKENKQLNNGIGVDLQNGSATGLSSHVLDSTKIGQIHGNNLKLFLKNDIDIKRCEKLRTERKTMLEEIREIKARSSEIRRQEEEVIHEVSSNQHIL